MYKCINCDYKFETPQKMTYEDFYSIKSMFGFSYNNTLDVCPNCKDNSIEIIKEEYEEQENETSDNIL